MDKCIYILYCVPAICLRTKFDVDISKMEVCCHNRELPLHLIGFIPHLDKIYATYRPSAGVSVACSES